MTKRVGWLSIYLKVKCFIRLFVFTLNSLRDQKTIIKCLLRAEESGRIKVKFK